VISEHIEFATNSLCARKYLFGVSLFLVKLPSNFRRAHARVKTVRAKASVRLTLTIHQISNVREQIGKVRFRWFPPRQSLAPVDAFDTAAQLMQSFTYRRAIPAHLLLCPVRHTFENILYRSCHEQTPSVPFKRFGRLLKQILDCTNLCIRHAYNTSWAMLQSNFSALSVCWKSLALSTSRVSCPLTYVEYQLHANTLAKR
jgi:hypothetical protein